MMTTTAFRALAASCALSALACNAKDRAPASTGAVAQPASDEATRAAPADSNQANSATAAPTAAAAGAPGPSSRRIAFFVDRDRAFVLACWDNETTKWSEPVACVTALGAEGRVLLGDQAYTVTGTIDETDEYDRGERHGIRLDRAGPDTLLALAGAAPERLVHDFDHTRRQLNLAEPAEVDPATKRAVAGALQHEVEAISWLQTERADVDGDGSVETLVSVSIDVEDEEEAGITPESHVLVVTAGSPARVRALHSTQGARLRVLGALDLDEDRVLELWIYRIRDEYEDELITTVVAGKPKVLGEHCCHM